MANTVGQFQQAAFTSPAYGDSPISSSVVRGNDNSVATQHNGHDADYTIHVQQSVAGSRPAAGTVGRIWFTSDTYQLAYDTGAAWQSVRVSAANVTSGTFGAGSYTFPGAVNISGAVLTASSVTVGTDLLVTGVTALNGNVTFGDATTDTVSFTARVASGIVPNTNVSRDLGTNALSFRTVYASAMAVYNVTAGASYLTVGGEGSGGVYAHITDGFTSLATQQAILFGYNGTNRIGLYGLNSTSPVFAPFTDNQGSLGSASLRFNNVRVGTGASQFDGLVTMNVASSGVYAPSLQVQTATDGDVYRLGMGRNSSYVGNVVVGRDGGAGSTGTYLAVELRDTLGSVNEVARWTEGGQLQLAPRAVGTVAVTLNANASTATTVGAAGAASALPAQPTGYLRISIGGTVRKIPFYAD